MMSPWVGTHLFQVNAADRVGNRSSASLTYTVSYAVCPLYDPSAPLRIGPVAPIMLHLCDATGRNVSSSSCGAEGDRAGQRDDRRRDEAEKRVAALRRVLLRAVAGTRQLRVPAGHARRAARSVPAQVPCGRRSDGHVAPLLLR